MLKDGEAGMAGDDQPFVFETSPSCKHILFAGVSVYEVQYSYSQLVMDTGVPQGVFG